MEKNYWKSLEERAKDASLEVTRGKEFLLTPEELAVEEAAAGKSGVTRREFLKLMGASLVMASATSACRRPIEKIIPYLNKPEEITPGVANWYASTCGECPAGCGLLTKTREGRPVKLEGNPDHPMNRGGLCPRGQASLLNLYDPDRLKGPVRRSSATGRDSWETISWETVAGLFHEKKGKTVLLTDSILSPTTQKLMGEFLEAFPKAQHVSFEPLSLETLMAAQKDSYGEAVVPRYRFDKAEYILSFGADFLDTWLSPVEFTKQFSRGRKLENGKMSRFVAFESVPTLTGTNADWHIPVAIGDELKIALSLAHEIVVAKKLSPYASSPVVASLSPFPIETVATQTGLEGETLRQIASELWKNKGRGLVLGGGYPLNNPLGKALHIVVNFLNSVLGNEGVTIDGRFSPSLQSSGARSDLQDLMMEMERGGVACLIIYKTNPVYILGDAFEKALQKVDLVVRLGDRLDETALKSHWVLPLNHYLESWGDASAQKGLWSLVQPAIRPLYDTKSFEDILLSWMGRPETFHDVLKNFWKENLYPNYGGGVSFNRFWESVLREGVLDTRPSWNSSSPRPFKTEALLMIRDVLSFTLSDLSSTTLVAHPTIPHYDGRHDNNSWLMELPDPVTKITWTNYLSLSPKKATDLKLREGDIVRVKTKEFESELAVHLQPGLHERVFAVPLGFGHTKIGRVGDNVGVNAFRFGFVNAATLEKTGKWVRLPSTQQHQVLEGRPIVRETTLTQYQKDPKAGNEEEGHLPSMWSGHKYEGYRWGMAIDLNACTGCSACMIACQAENNIPVVGEKRIKQGREMHWIRIDRYYSGEEQNPEVLHQPMLCQHCENAPCETVCPVLATLHNEEGLNVQVYNRCVGTRYCSNNCPYKVRRFNWFEYLRGLETPLAMVLNPDVTVREKGVMEKCTFCVQRIQEGKDKAKDFGRSVQDGEIKTACQQSCPAEAIVFGNLNDRESAVSKIERNPRGYKVLADLNTRPSITYLTKVRHKV